MVMGTFKITATNYDKTVTIELDHSDVDIEELYETFRGIALALGYDQENVDEVCPRETDYLLSTEENARRLFDDI